MNPGITFEANIENPELSTFFLSVKVSKEEKEM